MAGEAWRRLLAENATLANHPPRRLRLPQMAKVELNRQAVSVDSSDMCRLWNLARIILPHAL
jgi:hypothetical protein